MKLPMCMAQISNVFIQIQAQGQGLRDHLGDRSSIAGLLKLLAVLRKLVFGQILGIDNARRFSWNLIKRTVDKGQH